jgi:hypothetical protein
MVKTKQMTIAAAIAVLLALGGGFLFLSGEKQHPAVPPAPVASTPQSVDVAPINADFKEALASYRKIIILLADGKTLSSKEREEDLARTKKLYSREQIIKDHGVVLPYPEPKASAPGGADRAEEGEIFDAAPLKKTIVLTFDDGPHRRGTTAGLALPAINLNS